MKHYHVLVEQEDNWFIGRVLEREGVTTQGRTIDELIFMVRDAIELMWDERNVELELVIPGKAKTAIERRKSIAKRNGPHKSSSRRPRLTTAQ